MNIVKKLLGASLAISMLAGCSSKIASSGSSSAQPAGESGTYTIAAAIHSYEDPFMNMYREELSSYFKKIETDTVKYNVTMTDSKNDAKEQLKQIDEFIAQKVNVIIVDLADRASADTIVQKATEAGIPLVFIHNEPFGAEGEGNYRGILDNASVCYVGTRASQAGTSQGEIVAELANHGDLNGDGKVSYLMIEGAPEDLDAQYRTEYSIKALQASGIEVECVDDQIAYWDREQSKQITADALAQYGHAIEVIFCNNDTMAYGASDAIKEAGRTVGTDIYLIGADAGDESIEMFQKGELTGTVLNGMNDQCHKAADAAVQLIKGEAVENYYLFDYVKIR